MIDMNYALVVGKVRESKFVVFHICFYELLPTQSDIDSLQKELESDEEFDLTDKMDGMQIKPCKVEKDGKFSFIT